MEEGGEKKGRKVAMWLPGLEHLLSVAVFGMSVSGLCGPSLGQTNFDFVGPFPLTPRKM